MGAFSDRFRDLGKAKYDPVGRCIYCGSTDDLTREHIVPLGLSGTAVLPKSSCKRCAKITGRVEQIVLRGPMWPVRVLRELKSRSKHQNAPSTYPLIVDYGNGPQKVHLPISDFPILLNFPVFAPPACLDPDGYEKGIRFERWVQISFGKKPDEVISNLKAKSITLKFKEHFAEFARMLAKIAFCYAVAEDQLKYIEEPSTVLPAILGQSNDVGRWVGAFTEPITRLEGELHRLFIHRDHQKGLLIGEVHLFADSETPRYGVVLGKLKQNPEEGPAKQRT